MKKINLFIVIATLFLGVVACNSQKTSSESAKDEAVLKDFPELEGYKPQLISLKTRSGEELLKVELIAGKTMEVDDCNNYGLQGEFEQKEVSATGTPYFVFNSNGEVFQTMMGCPDDKMHTEFVGGLPLVVDYNSTQPLVVYLPDGVELKHNVWKVSDLTTAALDAVDPVLEAVSEKKNDYDTYVLNSDIAPKNSKIEIIPGIVKEVDCNQHWLLKSDFVKQTVANNSFLYLVFESDGQHASTRMGCPDDKLTATFIHGDSDTHSFDDGNPIVISVPKGFELRYRVWEKVD